MSPVPGYGQISMTKNVHPADLRVSLGGLQPGVDTGATVRTALRAGNAAHDPLWDDIVTYDPSATPAGVLRDDAMLAACRSNDPEALLLVWAALVLADDRMSAAVQVLAAPSGRLDPAAIHRAQTQKLLAAAGLPATDKDTTNLLGLLEDVGLLVPARSAGSVVGVNSFLPTAHAVPALVRLLEERLPSVHVVAGAGSDWVDVAVALGANTWLNLTPQEFRDAAVAVAVTTPRATTGTLPGHLAELHAQLRRQLQVVLQGPPGGGKTFRAREYINWAAAGAPEPSRLQSVVESLPANQRDPRSVAQQIIRRGYSAVWDIVQFHPAYSYSAFVRALVAQPVAGGVTFAPQHRILSFTAAVAEELARFADPVPVYFVVDEINRGDISAIFGELLYALEYRGEPVMTPYAVDGRSALVLPRNLFVIGTMNTADRSIAVIDYALRRRFVFLDVPADRGVLLKGTYPAGAQDAALYLFDAVEKLLTSTAPGMRVGPSYFLLPKTQAAATAAEAVEIIASRFAYEVLPLLREYQMEGELDQAELDLLLARLGIRSGATQLEASTATALHLSGIPWQPPPPPPSSAPQLQPRLPGNDPDGTGTATPP